MYRVDMQNYGVVGTVNATNGCVWNWENGNINTLNFLPPGGRVDNEGHNSGTIVTANLWGGGVVSGAFPFSTNVTLDSNLYNNGTIGTVNVYSGGGLSNNQRFNHPSYPEYNSDGTVSVVNLFAGSVSNGSRIDELNYFYGTYRGSALTHAHGTVTPGSIGTLTLAGNSANNTGDWGIIENLKFSSNGNGIVSIVAFTDGTELGFNGIQADYVNLTYSNILLDLTALGENGDAFFGMFESGFSFAPLFGADIEGTFKAFQIVLGEDFSWEDELRSFLNVNFVGNWAHTGTALVLGDFADPTAVPEPATLAILGLGLAGLAVARRRK